VTFMRVFVCVRVCLCALLLKFNSSLLDMLSA